MVCLKFFTIFSAGGLVTAVAPVVIKGNGLWVGWPGIHSKEPLGEIPESDPSDQTPTAGLRSDQVRKTINLTKDRQSTLFSYVKIGKNIAKLHAMCSFTDCPMQF